MTTVKPLNEISQEISNTHTYCITVEFEPSNPEANKCAFKIFDSLGYGGRKSKDKNQRTSKMYFKRFTMSKQEAVKEIQRNLEVVKEEVLKKGSTMKACVSKVVNDISEDMPSFSTLFDSSNSLVSESKTKEETSDDTEQISEEFTNPFIISFGESPKPEAVEMLTNNGWIHGFVKVCDRNDAEKMHKIVYDLDGNAILKHPKSTTETGTDETPIGSLTKQLKKVGI